MYRHYKCRKQQMTVFSQKPENTNFRRPSTLFVDVKRTKPGPRNERKKKARNERNLSGQFSKFRSKPLHFFDRNERNLSGKKMQEMSGI